MVLMHCIRKYSTASKNFYITTPIYYVNASPHIGHLYTSVIADCIQKWNKLIDPKRDVFFATGTDEHGSKIQKSAFDNKKSPYNYCTEISLKYKNLFDKFNVDYNTFVRTTDSRHKNAVYNIWEKLDKNGSIYRSKYCGWYCVPDETFLTELELTDKILPNGEKIKVSLQSGHPVELTEEDNYIFKLKNFQENLRIWLSKNENAVKPKKFHKILLDTLQDDLPDLSISRPSSRVHWGIPVPGDDTQTIYVWLDALINYLTAVGYPDTSYKNYWPPDVQMVGKDILKFHGIYWPAFLMAAGLELPKTILCHSHWTVNGEKMSKSKNNVVCPIERSDIFSTDGIRYFLLREGVAHSDGNYSEIKVMRILNSELADTLGNLLSRCCGASLNTEQTFPAIDQSVFKQIISTDVGNKLLTSLENLEGSCYDHYREYNFYKVVDRVISSLHAANLFFETMKPWELKKNGSQKELDVVLHVTMETLRICGIVLQPIIPNLSTRLLDKLNISKDRRLWDDLKRFSWDNANSKSTHLSQEKVVLFKRIQLEDETKKLKKRNALIK